MDIRLEFTDREITPWGGMALMKRMMDHMGMARVLGDIGLPVPGSNRGYDPVQVVMSFWVSVWCGANRFMHTEVTRQDEVLRKIFGWKRMCGADTYRRFFSKFTQGMNQRVIGSLFRWLFDQMLFDNYTLDLDSTVNPKYGEQEGVVRGYNPKKPGRGSHHPLMAIVHECRMVANMWLRRGDSHTANNLFSFLEDTLQRLVGKRIGLLRADSGFYGDKTFEYLEREQRPINYIIAAPLHRPVQRMIAGHGAWVEAAEGIEVAEATYKAVRWSTERRMVIVRQSVQERPKASGKRLGLFPEEDCYRYHCYITNLDLPAVQVWNMYRERAEAENRIKELKYDFGFGGLSVKGFYGTEAALSMAIMAYNLMSLFRQVVIRQKQQQRLSTLRYRMFGIGGYMVKEGNARILRLSLSMKRREWFYGLWENSSKFTLPTPVT